MSRRPLLAATVAAALAVLLLTSAGRTRLGAQTGEIVLGMSAAFTGPSADLGIELYRGSMAYFAAINEKGGVNGQQIRIQAYDDAYDPTRAILNTIKLIEQDRVLLLFNYVGTPTVTRVLPLLAKFSNRNIRLFFPFSGAQPQREPPYAQYAYNLRGSYRDETADLVNDFMSTGLKRIGIFYQIDAYGRSGWDGVRRALGAYGLKIVAEATYPRGAPYTSDLSKQVAILRAADAQAVISIGAYAASAAFVRDAVDAGWNVPIANVSFVGSESMLQLLMKEGQAKGKDYTQHLMNSQAVPSYEDLSLPAVREYRDLTQRYSPDPPPGFGDALTPPEYSFVGFEGFLNAKLMVYILDRMGSVPDAMQLAQVVESIHDLDLGIAAPVTFGPNRNQGLSTVYSTRVDRGRFVPLAQNQIAR